MANGRLATGMGAVPARPAFAPAYAPKLWRTGLFRLAVHVFWSRVAGLLDRFDRFMLASYVPAKRYAKFEHKIAGVFSCADFRHRPHVFWHFLADVFWRSSVYACSVFFIPLSVPWASSGHVRSLDRSRSCISRLGLA